MEKDSPSSRISAFAGLASASVAIFAASTYFIFRPLAAHGFAQPVASGLCSLGDMMTLPGRVAVMMVREENVRCQSFACSIYALLFISFLYFFIFALFRTVWLHLESQKSPPSPSLNSNSSESSRFSTALADAGMSRRGFLRMSSLTMAGGVASGFLYSLEVEPRSLVVERHIFPVRDLPASLDGLRVVQLTDIHHGPYISLQHVNRAVRLANSLSSDLIVLTGDYVYQSPKYIAPVARALSKLRAHIGLIAVLGNHDWAQGEKLTRESFEASGIRFVDNNRIIITPNRHFTHSSAEGLCIAGVGDFWTDQVDLKKALGGLSPHLPRLLLSHNPDVAEHEELLKHKPRVDLMMCGHTHGGQVRLPVMGTLAVPSKFGQKYVQGFVQGPACPVYISRGIGVTIVPMRLGVPPEVTFIELKST